MKETRQNSKCFVEYRPEEKEIFARDLTDHYNDPAMFTKTKRGIRNAWAAIVLTWHDDMTMHDVINILGEYKIRTHYWCMVD